MCLVKLWHLHTPLKITEVKQGWVWSALGWMTFLETEWLFWREKPDGGVSLSLSASSLLKWHHLPFITAGPMRKGASVALQWREGEPAGRKGQSPCFFGNGGDSPPPSFVVSVFLKSCHAFWLPPPCHAALKHIPTFYLFSYCIKIDLK